MNADQKSRTVGLLGIIVLLLAGCQGDAQTNASRSTPPDRVTTWVHDNAANCDPLFAHPAGPTDPRVKLRQDQFMARMTALPNAADVQKAAAAIVRLVGYQDLVLALPAYGPLWNGNVFQADRLAVFESRAAQLTPERLQAWRERLSAATSDGIGGVWTALIVLATDSLWSKDVYLETRADTLMARLKVTPRESAGALASALGVASGQAAMSLAETDWAFLGSAFQADAVTTAVGRLAAACQPKK